MPNSEEINALVQRMPDLDRPPSPAGGEERRQGHAAANGKLTGPTWNEAEKIYDQILSGGSEAVAAVIELIKHPDTGADYKPRYVLYGLAIYTLRPGLASQRAAVIEGIISRLHRPGPRPIRAFLVQTLQVCGDGSALPALAQLLGNEELCDPAAQAMVALRGDAAEHLRKALPAATGRCRLAIVQALGALADPAATDALIEAAADGDEDVRLTALWALARIASPKAVEIAISASGHGEGWAQTQSEKAALLLADNLAAAGRSAEADRIYRHLSGRSIEPEKAHLREAAERGLSRIQ